MGGRGGGGGVGSPMGPQTDVQLHSHVGQGEGSGLWLEDVFRLAWDISMWGQIAMGTYLTDDTQILGQISAVPDCYRDTD